MSAAGLRISHQRDFRALQRNGQVKASFILASYIAQIVASVVAGYVVLHAGGAVAYAAAGLLAVFIATRLRGLNNIVHECSHCIFTAKRGDNAVFGKIAAAWLLSSFLDYRREHMTHHAHLGDAEKDMDLRALRRFRLEHELTLPTIARHALTPLLGLHLRTHLSVDLSARDGAAAAILKFGIVSSAIGVALFDGATALFLIVLPFVWLAPAINYWMDCVDHAGLLAFEDDLERSRNLKLPWPVRAILFPRNDNYHLVHHLFPSVPVEYFGACHAVLMRDPAYRRANGNASHRRRPGRVAAMPGLSQRVFAPARRTGAASLPRNGVYAGSGAAGAQRRKPA